MQQALCSIQTSCEIPTIPDHTHMEYDILSASINYLLHPCVCKEFYTICVGYRDTSSYQSNLESAQCCETRVLCKKGTLSFLVELVLELKVPLDDFHRKTVIKNSPCSMMNESHTPKI